MVNATSPINTARPIKYNPNYNDIQVRGEIQPY